MKLDNYGSSTTGNTAMLSTGITFDADRYKRLVLDVADGNGGGKVDSGIDSQVGIWKHLFVTVQNGTANFYVNGVLAQSGAVAGTPTTLNPAKLIFGHHFGDFQSHYIADDARLYNRALSTAEINQLYTVEKPPVPIIVNQPVTDQNATTGTTVNFRSIPMARASPTNGRNRKSTAPGWISMGKLTKHLTSQTSAWTKQERTV